MKDKRQKMPLTWPYTDPAFAAYVLQAAAATGAYPYHFPGSPLGYTYPLTPNPLQYQNPFTLPRPTPCLLPMKPEIPTEVPSPGALTPPGNLHRKSPELKFSPKSFPESPRSESNSLPYNLSVPRPVTTSKPFTASPCFTESNRSHHKPSLFQPYKTDTNKS